MNTFLVINGIEIPDIEEGQYQAHQVDTGSYDRMISGRLVHEQGIRYWVVEVNWKSIDATTAEALSASLRANTDHQLFFLPSTGGTTLESGYFKLTELPAPTLQKWTGEIPEWAGYTLHFEGCDGDAGSP